jgi:hypothetical protein
LPSRRAYYLQENYPSVANGLLRPIVHVFSAARAVCDGDLDKFLMLLVIAMRTTEHPDFKHLTHSQIMTGEPAVLPSLGANIRSVAASLGIPKETARRKLADMVDAGWLVRVNWDIRLTAVGYAALDPARAQIQAMALSHHDLLSDMFRD